MVCTTQPSVYSESLIHSLTTTDWEDFISTTVFNTTSEDVTPSWTTTGNVTKAASSFGKVIFVYSSLVICAFGIVCNVLNLCVLSQPMLSDSPYTFLKAIAIADLGVLTLSFTHLVSNGRTRSLYKAVYDIYIFFAIANIFFTCSVWFIVLMTIERMLFVVRPLLTRSSKKRARIKIVIVVLCCCLLNIPRFLCYEVRQYKETDIYFPSATEFQKSDVFYGTSWLHALMINLIPMISLIVTNSVLIHAIHRARKDREAFQMNSNQEESCRKDESRLTKTLVTVVILFIVCTLPSAFVSDPIAYTLFSGKNSWSEYLTSPTNQTLINITNLLLFLNCSLNFVLYCAFNDRFRRAMARFFGRLGLGKDKIHMSSFSGSHYRSSDSTKTSMTSITRA